MKRTLIIKDTFNDVFTDYKDKISTVTVVVDTEEDCECTTYRKCGVCKLIEKYGKDENNKD